MKKSYLILAILAVLLTGVYISLSGTQTTGPSETSETVEAPEPSLTSEGSTKDNGADLLTGMYGLSAVRWIFTETKPGDGMNPPLVAVRIQPLGVTRPDGRPIEVLTWRVGQQQGSCSEIEKPADEKTAAMSYAQCWWAGGGDQFRAVRDGNVLRVDVRGVDEAVAEPAAWKQVLVIDLAAIVN